MHTFIHEEIYLKTWKNIKTNARYSLSTRTSSLLGQLMREMFRRLAR